MPMMFEAAVNEFPFVVELPKKEKSRLAKVWEMVKELQAVTAEKGDMIPGALGAKALGVSHERMRQLITSGKLDGVRIDGHVFVSVNSVVAYAQSERKTGRPVKHPEGFVEVYKASRDAMKNPM